MTDTETTKPDDPLERPMSTVNLSLLIHDSILSTTTEKQRQKHDIKTPPTRQRGWLSSLALPSVQGLIQETQDRVPRLACAWSLLLPLPVSLPLSLCVSLMNK